MKTNPPVMSLMINSGPTCNKVNTPNILPTIQEIDQIGVKLNNEFKKLLFKINLGLKIKVINVIIPEIANVIAIIYGSDIP